MGSSNVGEPKRAPAGNKSSREEGIYNVTDEKTVDENVDVESWNCMTSCSESPRVSERANSILQKTAASTRARTHLQHTPRQANEMR